MHEKYGHVVRISPTCLSFTNAEAWKDIYRSSPKDPDVYAPPTDGIADIGSAADPDHARIQSLFSHGVSDHAVKQQEATVQSYVDTLILKLRQKAKEGEPVNMVRCINFTTFDIIGALCFGEDFDALQNEDYNFWIANIFRGLEFVRMFRVLRAYPIVGYPLLSMLRLFPGLEKARQRHTQYTQDKVARRLGSKSPTQDIMSHVLRHNGERGMTEPEIMKTSGTVIIAGSETSGTLLSGALYHLLKHPTWITKLQHEVDAAAEVSGLSFASLAQLTVLHAIIQEVFRMYPPVPTILPRQTPVSGAIVNGIPFPSGISVGIVQYPANRSSQNFTDADIFAPERWLGHPHYQSDNLKVIQPFSVGSRNCLGQSLAKAEIKLILAHVVRSFDFELDERCHNWEDQKVSILWEKKPLVIKLREKI
ncbi:toxin biosynthesis cytochrome P450 monooxygenase [Bimuria novae-zelandiae CBS 107.79]|uniref:Toxin biosynthesis cytochrome P450 monooxygenase n=1 Tax=Bimuria novae-zelandiae CBS 107.79 TaxID=1447943 RepID=A0A6A5VLV8_9PLEO|nr:toxin biosynthesis cytochrome P450 monooxygenase [Bimuria novae-zelandiae CBS 107.79]